jgi:hypothetical protein
MRFRRSWLVTAAVVVVAVVIGRTAATQIARYRFVAGKTATAEQRQRLFEMLQPVALANCNLERFGEAHDGGYLMCGNLLAGSQAGYSYGISGYDQWGCDISTKVGVTVHQYDCFDTRQPACATGRTVFHAECVADSAKTENGRPFDTIANQLSKNGDTSKRLAFKIDVEGAEWSSFLATADDVLEQIDQLVVEFHWVEDRRSLAVVERLKRFFEVAHIHYNNSSCIDGMEPFPTWAYEVLFVNKRLAAIDPSGHRPGLHPLDAPNIPSLPDCQITAP